MPREPLDRRTFLKGSAAIAAASWLGGRTCRAEEPGDGSHRLRSQAELFLDDRLVDRAEGLSRTVHKPVKQGLIQEADGAPWEIGGVTTVVRGDDGRFHMMYNLLYWDPAVRDLHPSIGEDKAHWFRIVPCYATSEDGLRWQKPVLGLVDGPTGFRPAPRERWRDGVFQEPAGFSRQNNQGCPIASIQDLAAFGNVADPQKRFLINVISKDDTHAFAKITDAGLYFASDVPNLLNDAGWRKRMQPIWEGARSGPRGAQVHVAGFDDREQQWFECDQCSFAHIKDRGRQISRWTSRDLVEWSPEQLVLPMAEDESRDRRDYVEYMTIRVYRTGSVWLGLLNIFHGDRTDPMGEMPTQKNVWRKGLTELRLITCRDAGKTWQRVDGKHAWLPSHQEENGYDRLIGMGESLVRVGDDLCIYYGCWDGDHLSWNRDGTTYYKDRVRVWRTALAKLRWNGFVSLDARDGRGSLLTRPVRLEGRQLSVNAVAAGGSLRVQIEDEQTKPLLGFAFADCQPVHGNGVDQAVRWQNAADLARLAGRPVRLRFELEGASLYGVRTTA